MGSSNACELAELTGLEARRADGAEFRDAIPNKSLGGRLEQVDGLVEDSRPSTVWQMLDTGTTDISWLLLKHLHVRLLQLEGGEQSDWTSVVTLLTPMTVAGTAEASALISPSVGGSTVERRGFSSSRPELLW